MIITQINVVISEPLGLRGIQFFNSIQFDFVYPAPNNNKPKSPWFFNAFYWLE